MSFRESWLIPKDLISDFLEFRKNYTDEMMEKKQEGGGEIPTGNNVLTDSAPKEPKEFTRFKLLKNYLNQNNPRDVDPHLTALASTGVTAPSTTPKINLNLVKSFFPESERFKIATIVAFINQKLPFRIQTDKELGLTLDNKYYWNTSLPEVLMFLYGINRRYVSEDRTVRFRGITYGIPKGTEKFIEILQEIEPELSKLSISTERLKILKKNLRNTNIDGDNDDDDNDDNDNDDNDDDDGNDKEKSNEEEDGETPWTKPATKKKRRNQKTPAITPRQINFSSPSQQKELEGATAAPAAVISTDSSAAPNIDFSPEPYNELVEESFRANDLPSIEGGPPPPPSSAPPVLNRDVYTQQAMEDLIKQGAKPKNPSSMIPSLNKWGATRQEREMKRLSIAPESTFAPAASSTRRKTAPANKGKETDLEKKSRLKRLKEGRTLSYTKPSKK